VLAHGVTGNLCQGRYLLGTEQLACGQCGETNNVAKWRHNKRTNKTPTGINRRGDSRGCVGCGWQRGRNPPRLDRGEFRVGFRAMIYNRPIGVILGRGKKWLVLVTGMKERTVVTDGKSGKFQACSS
jgi:hypothetical protein